MVWELLTQIISQLQGTNSILLLIVFFIFLILAYKLFQTVIKALIVGVIAAAFPFVANMVFGFNLPITLSSVLWFAIFGILIYFAYAFISGGVKIIKIVLSPFKVLFRKKKKKE